MLPQLAIAVIWPLGIIGVVLFWMFAAYRRAIVFPEIKYRILSTQSVPMELSNLMRDARALGFQYLAGYAMELPPEYGQQVPNSYVLQNEDGTIKAMLVQHATLKGVAFQTVFPDGGFLVTIHGMPASPFLNAGTDDLYRMYNVKGSVSEALEVHRAKVSEFASLHGEPIRSQTASEYRDLMQQYLREYNTARIKRVTIGHFRRAMLLALGISGAIVFVALAAFFANDSMLMPFLPLMIGGALLLSLPIVFAALWLTRKLQQDIQ